MLAEIIIDELQLSTIIGCMKNERTTKQALTLSLAIQYDISNVSKSDNIDDALNYATICHDLKEKIEHSSFHLLEALSEFIFEYLFTHHQIERVSLFIYKPNAISFTKRIGLKRVKSKADSPPTHSQSTQRNHLNWD